MNELIGKVPPNVADIESAVLGALMLEKEAYLNINSLINEDDFYVERHAIVYKVIKRLHSESQPVDMLTVIERLRHIGKLDTIGGAFFISELTQNVASAAHIEYHAKVIKEKSISRQIIKFSSDLQTKAYENMDDAIEFSRSKLFSILESITSPGLKSWQEVLPNALDTMHENTMKLKSGEKSGIPTGLSILNDFTGGWQKTDLIILAGRPAMGKTSITLNFANHALRNGYKALIYSLEMNSIQLANKFIGYSGVSPRKMRTGELNDKDFADMDGYIGEIEKWDLNIDDTAGITIGQLESTAEKEKLKNGLDIIFIDYLQLIENSYGMSVNDKVSNTSRRLKSLARKLDVPIICLSQLSRDGAKQGRPPQLTDLRDSGAIEQDADMVLFIHRSHYYNPDDFDEKGLGDLIMAKNRHGEVGNIRFRHNEIFTKFEDYETKPITGSIPEFQPIQQEIKSPGFDKDAPF